MKPQRMRNWRERRRDQRCSLQSLAQENRGLLSPSPLPPLVFGQPHARQYRGTNMNAMPALAAQNNLG